MSSHERRFRFALFLFITCDLLHHKTKGTLFALCPQKEKKDEDASGEEKKEDVGKGEGGEEQDNVSTFEDDGTFAGGV